MLLILTFISVYMQRDIHVVLRRLAVDCRQEVENLGKLSSKGLLNCNHQGWCSLMFLFLELSFFLECS